MVNNHGDRKWFRGLTITMVINQLLVLGSCSKYTYDSQMIETQRFNQGTELGFAQETTKPSSIGKYVLLFLPIFTSKFTSSSFKKICAKKDTSQKGLFPNLSYILAILILDTKKLGI